MLVMEHPFEEPRLLIDHARINIQNLEAGSSAFTDSCRGVEVEELDHQTRQKIIKLRVTGKIPGPLRPIASGIVNDLRHSLDQSMNEAIVRLGAKKRDTYFPFAKNAGSFDELFKSDRYKSICPDLRPYLGSVQLYGGGDDLLYTLNRIAGPNKHQLVLRLGAEFGSFWTDGKVEFRGPGTFGLEWDRKRQELEIARIGPGGFLRMHDQSNLSFFVSIDEGETARSQPASAFLDTLATKVEGIVAGLEAETARILRERGG